MSRSRRREERSRVSAGAGGGEGAAGRAAWRIEGAAVAAPLIATAIHDGHDARPEVATLFALNDDERRREEDPFTAEWVGVAPVRVVGHRSRFEVDLNRPREKAVYRTPEDAWGLTVWRGGAPPPDGMAARSLAEYDAFYDEVGALLRGVRRRHGAFVVLDLHTYNHRRGGPDAPPAPPDENPEVNVGTGTLTDRARWEPLIGRFLADLSDFDFRGRRLDVRENVKFRGGQFGRWVHETFPGDACVLSVEFKKFFMDEWTGEPDPEQVAAIQDALASTVPGLRDSLAAVAAGRQGRQGRQA